MDVVVEASDRQGLVRDISELFAKEKMNVSGVRTHAPAGGQRGTASMTFTVDVTDTTGLAAALARVAQLAGVRSARRK